VRLTELRPDTPFAAQGAAGRQHWRGPLIFSSRIEIPRERVSRVGLHRRPRRYHRAFRPLFWLSVDRFNHFLNKIPQCARWMAIAHVSVGNGEARCVILNSLGQLLPFGSGRRHQNRTQGGYDAIQRSICSHRFPSAVHGLGYLNRREGAGASNVCANKSLLTTCRPGRRACRAEPREPGKPQPRATAVIDPFETADPRFRSSLGRVAYRREVPHPSSRRLSRCSADAHGFKDR
jgi:hypothetical protein